MICLKTIVKNWDLTLPNIFRHMSCLEFRRNYTAHNREKKKFFSFYFYVNTISKKEKIKMTKLLLLSDRQVQFEDVQFAFRPNLEGRKEKYNREGDRYFNIEIQDPDDARDLIQAGFNVKFQSAEDQFVRVNSRRAENGQEPLDRDQFEDFWYMKVPVYTQYAAPVIKVRDVTDIPDLDEEVETNNVVFLPVELFGDIDTMEADNVDVVLTYRQPHEDGRYVRPQLKTMYIDVISSPLERKHRY